MPGREARAGRKLGQRSNPLGDDICADRFASSKKNISDENDIGEDGLTPGTFLLQNKTTKRIFQRAREQLELIDEELQGGEAIENEEEEGKAAVDRGLANLLQAQDPSVRPMNNEEAEDEPELEYDDNESVMSELPADDKALMEIVGNQQSNLEAMYGIDEEEARLLQRFQPASKVQSRHLSGIIVEKIAEHTKNAAPQASSSREEGGSSIDPRVARVYTAIGTVLQHYTSGKVPKAFKVLPNIQNWEELLLLTKPDKWSPHAVYQATRIFSASLNEAMAQRFYASVLLPVIHDRLLEEKKLHPALFMAVRKALFKPVAFFKGFLLPLATDEECTLREALVISSVLQRSHLPPVPTAVALVKISQQPFRGPCAVFLRVLIDKQMSLPYQAIDALVAYFHRFLYSHPKDAADSTAAQRDRGEATQSSTLPVLWHQTLLSFVQRYKGDLTAAQVQLLMQVCSVHFHYLISPEIKRELGAAQKLLQQAGKQA